jgi:hypothetical protein
MYSYIFSRQTSILIILFFSHIGFNPLIKVKLLPTFILEVNGLFIRNLGMIDKQDVIDNQRIITHAKLVSTSCDLIKNNPVFEIPVSKDRKTF